MDDPEFQDCLKEVLEDDDSAKEAMKGLADMMNFLGKAMGPEGAASANHT